MSIPPPTNAYKESSHLDDFISFKDFLGNKKHASEESTKAKEKDAADISDVGESHMYLRLLLRDTSKKIFPDSHWYGDQRYMVAKTSS